MQIVFEGELGALLGETWDLDVSSPAEAIRAVGVQRPELIEYLNTCQTRGVTISISTGQELRQLLTEQEILELAQDIIIFSPIIQGEGGSPLVKGLLGVALVATAFLIPGGITLFGTSLSSAIGLIGGSMVLSGISSILSPSPRKSVDPQGKDSNIIDRAAELSKQGARVPLAYGEVMVTDLIATSSGVTDEILIGVQDDYAIYTRSTQIELPYVATALQDYTYLTSPLNFRQQTPIFLRNNNVHTGMVIDRSPFGDAKIRVTFSEAPNGLNVRVAYPIQRIKIHNGLDGYQGASAVHIFDGDFQFLFSTGLFSGWTELDVSGLPQFNYPRESFIFVFQQENLSLPYIAVGELILFGAIGLDEGLGNIKS